MAKERGGSEKGVWVRLTLDTGASILGWAPGADSPNDFWTVFKTQLVRIEQVRETPPKGRTRDYPFLYVNRDRIVLVDVAGAHEEEEE